MFMLETFVIGIPSFFLAFLPNDKPITGKFIYNLIRNALPAAIALILNVSAVYLFTYLTEGTIDANETIVKTISTMCTITVTFTGLGLLIRLCKPWTVLTSILYITMFICCILGYIFLDGFIDTVRITLTQTLFVVILAIISPTLINCLYKLFEKIKI